MNKKTLAVAAAAAIGVALNLGSRAAQSRHASLPPLLSPANCLQPQWPAEARRYEIDGVTTIRFDIDADGKVRQPQVIKSSGWKILDDAALDGIARCSFKPEPGAAMRSFPLQYVWKFSDTPPARPLLVKDGCPPSDRFAGFREADKRASDRDGVLLRFLLDGNGMPVRVVAEAGELPPQLVEQAVQFVQGCRFAYDGTVRGERTDTAFGRVLIKTAMPAN